MSEEKEKFQDIEDYFENIPEDVKGTEDIEILNVVNTLININRDKDDRWEFAVYYEGHIPDEVYKKVSEMGYRVGGTRHGYNTKYMYFVEREE